MALHFSGQLMRRRCLHRLARALAAVLMLVGPCLLEETWAETAPEYSLKAAVLYNFALFTTWPDSVGEHVTLCVIGEDPFGAELDALQGESVGERTIRVRRLGKLAPLAGCQLLFITRSSMTILPQILTSLDGLAVLTVADSPGAATAGVGINMGLDHARVVFEINLDAVRRGGLSISSKLLRLAQVVHE